MSATMSRETRTVIESVYQRPLNKTANYSMRGTDTDVRVNISGGSVTITLPSVSEMPGVIYTIRVSAGAAAAAPNVCTIRQKGNDSDFWHGNILLYRPGQYVQLVSDGERWHKVMINSGAPRHYEKYIHEMFKVPFTLANASAGGGPLGTAGAINTLILANGNYFNYIPKGDGQTLTGPIWVNPGLNIACDLTDNDGLELNHGVGASSPFLFTVGTDPAFYVRCRFTIADVSGTDDCAVGFRKQEANQAAIDSYDEMAVLNVISGNITIETILNNAATVSTDTTQDWADAATHALTVKVSSAGVVTYEVDDAAPTVTAAFSFDNAEVVMPFFYFLHATTAPGAITLLEWECGYQ
jgi:hypothetical protein